MINYFLVAVLLLGITACATPYQQQSWFRSGGGYQQTPVSPKIERIEFFGNSRVSLPQLSRYTLLRCAEFAREQHKPYFVIYTSLTDAALNKSVSAPQLSHTGRDVHAVAFISLLDKSAENSFDTEKTYQQLLMENRL